MQPVRFTTPSELRSWLEANHDTATELVVALPKKGSGVEGLSWEQLVDEVLCFGWIDGRAGRIDERLRCIRITPRKKRSTWSNRNVGLVARLREEGRMTPAGEAAFAARREDDTGVYAFERAQEAELEPAHEARFREDATAWAWFHDQAPSYQRIARHWVVSAKREETRERRIDQLIADSAAGLRIKSQRR